jgi:hypothetical protein
MPYPGQRMTALNAAAGAPPAPASTSADPLLATRGSRHASGQPCVRVTGTRAGDFSEHPLRRGPGRPSRQRDSRAESGGSLRGCAKTQVALHDGHPVSLRPRLAEFKAPDWPRGVAKVLPGTVALDLLDPVCEHSPCRIRMHKYSGQVPTCAVDHRLAGRRNRQDSFYNRAPTPGPCKLMASACKQIIPPRLTALGGSLGQALRSGVPIGERRQWARRIILTKVSTFQGNCGEAPCPSLVMSPDDSLFHAKVGSRVGI